jgi:hypothetical protein
VSIDELGGIIDRAVKSLLISLRESGCETLDEVEIELVEAIILGSIARSGVMRVDDEPPCAICGGMLSVPLVDTSAFHFRLAACPNCCPTADSASG